MKFEYMGETGLVPKQPTIKDTVEFLQLESAC